MVVALIENGTIDFIDAIIEPLCRDLNILGNKKEFEKSLDDYYSNELVVDATHETITADY